MARERGFDRVVNYSDAVVAIAATLLILPLVDKASNMGSTPMPQFLQESLLSFVVFILSFAVIGRFWLAHHRFFQHLRGFSPGIMFFNLLWLLGIVFLPFPTELIVSGRSVTSLAAAVYIGTMLFISLSSLGLTIVARRNHAIVDDVEGVRKALVLSTLTSSVIAAALLVSLVWPVVGLWSLFLLLLTPVTRKLIDRISARRQAI
ncbi:MAG: DUF1211 domain-containing protein [Actinobacteria bacterium]|uniref:Unannotated protein n=1 Tax=freshwater metagenome TaxID=449393 RepID=A0A6J7GLK1_9ZZZZ|nr:DUF1211 domain-containing protein [Actinomycetota bacterium]